MARSVVGKAKDRQARDLQLVVRLSTELRDRAEGIRLVSQSCAGDPTLYLLSNCFAAATPILLTPALSRLIAKHRVPAWPMDQGVR